VNNQDLRDLLSTISLVDSNNSTPEPSQIFFHKSHYGILQEESGFLIGNIGSGKTFWWKTLLSERCRNAIREVTLKMEPTLKFSPSTLYSPGFGKGDSDDYPSSFVVEAILGSGISAKDIWKGIVAKQIWKLQNENSSSPPNFNWVDWCLGERKELENYEIQLQKEGRKHVWLFDELPICARAFF
jgi:hypothetical protein